MALLVVFDVPGMGADTFDKIWAALEQAGQEKPEGRLVHLAAPAPGGWKVVDVWESEEQLGAFAQTLMPIIAGLGVTPPTPQVLPIHYAVGI